MLYVYEKLRKRFQNVIYGYFLGVLCVVLQTRLAYNLVFQCMANDHWSLLKRLTIDLEIALRLRLTLTMNAHSFIPKYLWVYRDYLKCLTVTSFPNNNFGGPMSVMSSRYWHNVDTNQHCSLCYLSWNFMLHDPQINPLGCQISYVFISASSCALTHP